MTLPMARDLGKFGIRVVSVAPGPFRTPMGAALPEKVAKELSDSAALKRYKYYQQIYVRLGEPVEFADSCAGIVSNSYTTGCVVRLDGGMRMGL